MATHREMKALADNPTAAGALAQFLRQLPDAAWTDWEETFLDNLMERRSETSLSLRQCEVLVELRDAAQSFSKFEGFSVTYLVRQCVECQYDLEDDDVDFIQHLAEQAPKSLKRRPLMKLVAIARRLGVIDDRE